MPLRARSDRKTSGLRVSPRMFDDELLIDLLNDRVLRELIRAESDPARSKEIGRLIQTRAHPLVERVLEKHRTRGLQQTDVEDIAATVALRLTRKLQQVPYSVDEAIREFDAYVARTTINVLQDLERTRSPERTRLERRLRLLLVKDPRLALWTSSSGSSCGLAEWNARLPLPVSLPVVMPKAAEITGDVLTAVLRSISHPVLFETLLQLVAAHWGISDAAAVEKESAIDQRPGQEEQTAARQNMEILWREIVELPERQRTALLLNLRDAFGVNALELLPLTGVASFSEIARTLGLSVDALSALWNDLPLEDLKIASLIGATRQQVINLRKAARQRLHRRMARHEYPER
jgi:RNA polymerase sigma factor (sigma-70 family)